MMNALSLEAAFAEHLRANAPTDLEVRGGTSSEVLPEFDPMLMVQVTESQHLADGLYSATLFVAAVTPALIEGADPAEHAERIGIVHRAFEEWQYPLAAAASMKHAGYLLHGMWVGGNGVSRRSGGRWIDGIELQIGLETSPLWSSPGALAAVDLRDLYPNLPAVHGPGFGSLLDARDDVEDAPSTVAASAAQIVVPLVGTISVGGSPVPYIVRAWDDDSWGPLAYVASPGSIVAEGWVY
jgi:hypothetical protein